MIDMAQIDQIINLELTADDVVLPCPFCGSDDIELQNTWTAAYWLQCQECGVKMSDPGMDRDPNSLKDHQASKAGALAAWNRRV